MNEESTDLSQAIVDTELMIEYAATQGFELDQDVVEPVKDFARKWRDVPSQTSAADETKFWVATSQIAKIIEPVTPSSLRTLRDFDRNGPRSRVGKTVRWARIFTWTILIITLLVHSYENTLGTIIQEADKAAANFRSIQSKVALIKVPAESNTAVNIIDDKFVQYIEQSRGEYCTAVRTWSMQIGIIEGLIPQGEGSIPKDILSKIVQFSPFISIKSFGPRQIRDNEDGFIEENYPCRKDLSYEDVREKILSGSLGSHGARQIKQWAEVDRTFFAQFVLPLLYGMLGALASVVRALGTAVEDAQFSPALGLVYTLKVPLGALVGATVGIVIEAKTLASIAGLTSLGLAFGFAYAVDVFFSFLDELMARLSGKKQQI